LPYTVVADPGAGPEVFEDGALAERFESAVTAQLRIRTEYGTDLGELVGRLETDYALSLPDAITFGGEVTVCVEVGSGESVEYKTLLRGPRKWWRWEPPTRPPEGMDDSTKEYWELYRDGYLMVSGGDEDRYAGFVWDVPFEDRAEHTDLDDSDGRLVLRIVTENTDHDRIVYADLEAVRVLVGELVIPIRDWTVEELNRYRVSGVVPDHAMP